MAEIKDTRTPYELLVRGRPDGGIAAHVQYRRIVTLGDEVMKDEVEPAVAISPEALEGSPFQELIGLATVAAIQDNEARAAAMIEQAAKIESLTGERDQIAHALDLAKKAAAAAAEEHARKVAEMERALSDTVGRARALAQAVGEMEARYADLEAKVATLEGLAPA